MADTRLFSRLKRLFSTDVIIRNQGGNQLKVMDINKIQQSGEYDTNSLVDRFNRIYTTSPTSLYGYQSNFNYQTLRPQLYSEYDAMDTDAIIASALDIVADECTLKNDMGEVLQIRSSNEDIQKLLYNLFYDVLNVEFNLWMWVRQMCKYGDFFLKLDLNGIGFTRTHEAHLYHFGSTATKNGKQGEMFKATEGPAAQLFMYKWGIAPQLFNNLSHNPKNGETIKGIKYE